MFSRRIVLAPLFSLLVTVSLSATVSGVQSDFKDRLPGRWDGNKEKTKTYLSEHEDAPSMPPEMIDTMPDFQLEFDAAGKAKISMDGGPDGPSRTLEGTWEVAEDVDANNAVLKIMMMVEEKEDTKEVKIEFLDDDTIALSVENESTMVLDRAKDKAKGDSEDKSPAEPASEKKDGLLH